MLRKLSLVFVMLSGFFLYLNNVNAAIIPAGTTLYYDNSYTKWEQVSVFIWNDNTTGDITWKDPKTVMNCTNDICSYVVTTNNFNYDKIIFNSFTGSGGYNQTVNLAYIKPNYIFKASHYNSSDGKMDGNWYVLDTAELTDKKALFEDLKKDWYTAESYNSLKSLAENIINPYAAEYLKVTWSGSENKFKSSYETDLALMNTYFANLVITPVKLNNLLESLEMKTLSGYTLSSIIDFRTVIADARSYIASNGYTVSALEAQYDAVNRAFNNLVVTTEKEEKEVVEALKQDLNKLQMLLDNNTKDTQAILNVCREIEVLYEKLTDKNSDLTKTVNTLLSKSGGSHTDNEAVINFLKQELAKLNKQLDVTDIDVEEFENSFKKMETDYKSLLESNEEIKKLLTSLTPEKKSTDKLVLYLSVTNIILQTAILYYLTFKKQLIK